MRLLLLEDDNTLALGLCAYLRADGHVVDWCQRVAEAALLRNEPFDALLVDWQLCATCAAPASRRRGWC